MDGDKPKWEDVIINASLIDNGISIMFSYIGEEAHVGQVTALLQEDGKTLRSVITYHEDDKYIPTKEIEIHDLLVFWAIEASDSFEEIKKYINGLEDTEKEDEVTSFVSELDDDAFEDFLDWLNSEERQQNEYIGLDK